MQVDFHMSHLSRLRNTNPDVTCVCVWIFDKYNDAFQELLEDQNICCFCVSVSFVVIKVQCQLCCSVWPRSETERAFSGEKTGSLFRFCCNAVATLVQHHHIVMVVVVQASSRVAASQQTLQIFNLQREDYGVYQCFVARSAHQSSSFHREGGSDWYR